MLCRWKGIHDLFGKCDHSCWWTWPCSVHFGQAMWYVSSIPHLLNLFTITTLGFNQMYGTSSGCLFKFWISLNMTSPFQHMSTVFLSFLLQVFLNAEPWELQISRMMWRRVALADGQLLVFSYLCKFIFSMKIYSQLSSFKK